MSKDGPGRPCKYFSHVEPYLEQIAAWCRDGATLEDIAKNLDIAISSLCEYKNKYTELTEALKTTKDIADIKVENSLYKRANGYEYTEVTEEPLWNPITGEPVLDKEGNQVIRVTKRVTKQVVPDTTAQIFWLKNRKPKEWRDKQEIENHVSGELNVIQVKLPEELK